MAADYKGLGVRELDDEVVLLDSGELAMKFEGGLRLIEVELGADDTVLATVIGADSGAPSLLARVVVKVVEKPEERTEAVVVVVDGAWEEGHFG